jgi:hypothetical protein
MLLLTLLQTMRLQVWEGRYNNTRVAVMCLVGRQYNNTGLAVMCLIGRQYNNIGVAVMCLIGRPYHIEAQEGSALDEYALHVLREVGCKHSSVHCPAGPVGAVPTSWCRADDPSQGSGCPLRWPHYCCQAICRG